MSEWSTWKVKKLDDIDERNIRTSLYDSGTAFYKENYTATLVKLDKDKYDTCDKKPRNAQ